jgi:hypothetical protein
MFIKSVFLTGDCGMAVSGRSYLDSSIPLEYSAYHVVTNEQDFWYDFPTRYSNYWLVDDGKTGEDARLYMVFACPTSISGFRIKNTHNRDSYDRGTNKFKIFTSTSGSGPWTEILSSNLPDARNGSTVPLLQFALGSPITTQYVMFQIDSFYGRSGGLQYFATY